MSGRISIETALAGRLVVVCGPGGVGKTTTSAALALAAAQAGRKTLVCTIDPSKRLRTSLGLKRLTGAPQKVKGRLHAMRLDSKQTFDDLVRLDFYYLENWSIWLDVTILFKTPFVVISQRGAY